MQRIFLVIIVFLPSVRFLFYFSFCYQFIYLHLYGLFIVIVSEDLIINRINKIMKNLIFVFAVVLFGFGAVAQTAEFKGSADSFQTVVANGLFEIVMPNNTELAEVNRTSAYYTNYFTVEYSDETKVVKLKMVDNTPDGRRVINRFLLSNGVKEVKFEGNTYNINEFYSQFLVQQ